MIFNFSRVFECWTFIVRLMRVPEYSVPIKYTSRFQKRAAIGSHSWQAEHLAAEPSCCPVAVLGVPPAPLGQQGCSPNLSLNSSSVEMLIIFCEQLVSGSSLRHRSPAGGKLGAFLCVLLICPQQSPASQLLTSNTGLSERPQQLSALWLLGGDEISKNPQVWLPELHKSILAPSPCCYFTGGASREVSVWGRVNLNCNFYIIVICRGLKKLVSASGWCGRICSSREHPVPLTALLLLVCGLADRTGLMESPLTRQIQAASCKDWRCVMEWPIQEVIFAF